ncbi:MAG: biotin--[acetyl-CoA-carboxylase] ligase [Betaproteobacteria bacterium]|nr:biotin--[acetyl-CoA-carboxylase] ligase [Betaproteobacteria bacterium]
MRSLAIDLLRELTRHGPQPLGALAAACAATRGRTESCLARLAATGLLQPARGGLQLAAPFDFLSAERIRAALGVPELEVDVLDACPSTNSALMEGSDAGPKLLLTEEQTAGRGRRGRRWICCVGSGLTYSVRCRLHRSAREIQGLSLAVGVAVARTLRALGAAETELKWPNDLLVGGAKLGGILVETRVQSEAVTAVVGVGLNCRASAGLEARLKRRVAALEDFVRPLPSRNALAAHLVADIWRALQTFDAEGLAPFRGEWEAMHAYAGQRVRVRLADGRVLAGVADGLCEDGGLRLRTRSGVRAVKTGRVVFSRAA